MKKIKHIVDVLFNRPHRIFVRVLHLTSPLFSDKRYLQLLFPLNVGYKLNLKNPTTYNEKLQWLKLNYRLPIMTKMVDKYEAKKIVNEIIGEKYLIKTIGVWDSFDEIDFSTLPSKFVLKTTHDSGGVFIVKNKQNLDLSILKGKINKRLELNQYLIGREWPYKNVQPKIIAEEFLNDLDGDILDYKFFCFNGVVRAMFIASGRQSGEEVKFDFYDRNFNFLDIVQQHPNSGRNFLTPQNFDKMIELSERLSIGFPHIRVDFYNINGKIYFGEFTFYHHGGMKPFTPHKWDEIFGSWIDLENIQTVD